MIVIFDGDHYAFRAAVVSENDDLWIACSRCDALINSTLDELQEENYQIYVSGKGNFRKELYPEYKANRTAPRPKWEQAVRSYMVDQWEAELVHGMEADDKCGLEQSQASIISSNDKDLNQIEGWHYNFVKKEKYHIERDEGIYRFWEQMLVGDISDNVSGIRGIGPKKSAGILRGLQLSEMPGRVRALYQDDERFDLNCKLFWIRRPNGVTWEEWYDYSGISKAEGQISPAVCEGQDPGSIPGA